MLKRTHLQWIIIGIVVLATLIIGYLIYTRKKEGYSQQEVENIHAALKNRMEQELQAMRDGDAQLVDPPDDSDVQQSSQNLQGKNGVVALFYSNGCPHCRNMMDDWEQFKSSPEVANSGIAIREFGDGETQHHQVKGVPTIRYYPAGRFPDPSTATKYNGDRSAASLARFALSHGQQV